MITSDPDCYRPQPDVPPEVVQAMAQYADRFVVPIGGAQKDGVEICGTGLYLDFAERSLLLTAAHVLNQGGPEGNPYAFKVVQGNPPLSLIHPSVLLPEKGGAIADLAFVQVPDGYPASSNRVCLPASRLALSSNLIPADLLFLLGYSADQANFAFGTVLSTGFGRPTFRLSDEESKDNAQFYFYVDYSRNRLRRDGVGLEDPRPHGMSGSPIWRTNWHPNYHSWTPEDAEVCGIAARWDEGTASLAVVRIEHVHNFLALGMETLMKPADGWTKHDAK